MRQIVLDTETTGLEPAQGHRIIEIGCVELVNRRLTDNRFHHYLNPEREIDEGAVEVHGLTSEFLADKPVFADVVDDFIAFVRDAEVIIHNAPFDVAFIDHELARLGAEWGRLEDHCRVTDTLAMARHMHPGQKNSLDALCRRYGVDNSQRQLHGALLDAQILAEVYLAMTGGQADLGLEADTAGEGPAGALPEVRKLPADRPRITVLRASAEEQAAHRARLKAIYGQAGRCLWLEFEGQTEPAE